MIEEKGIQCETPNSEASLPDEQHVDGHHQAEGTHIGRETLAHATGLPAEAKEPASVVRRLRVEYVGVETPQVGGRACEEQQDHDQRGHVKECGHSAGIGEPLNKICRRCDRQTITITRGYSLLTS